MLAKVEETIEKYCMIGANDKIIVGVSGGADSVTLLNVLKKLGPKYSISLHVVHINHNLRGEDSIADKVFVEKLCKEMQIPVTSLDVDVASYAEVSKISLEESGRILRYEIFENVAKDINANKIAVAHNLNDNAETILFNLFRGTGLTGIRGIPPFRGKIIRPLIEVSRQEIEKYCEDSSLMYVIDKTNLVTDYGRNKIRLKVLPYLQQEINKGVLQNLTRFSEIIKVEDDFLNDVSSEYYNSYFTKVCDDNIEFNRSDVLKIPDAILRRVILKLLVNAAGKAKDISFVHVEEVITLLKKNSGKRVSLPYGLEIVNGYTYTKIGKVRNNVVKDSEFVADIKIDEPIFIEQINKNLLISKEKKNLEEVNVCTRIISCDRLKNAFEIRNMKPKDRIYFTKIGGHKKLSKYFSEKKVDKFLLQNILVLADGNDVILIFKDKIIFSDEYCLNESNECPKASNILFLYLWEEKNQ